MPPRKLPYPPDLRRLRQRHIFAPSLQPALHQRTAFCTLEKFLRSASRLTAYDFQNPRCTERSLASAHSCPQPLLESVETPGRKRRMQHPDDISLCNLFTPADHPGIPGDPDAAVPADAEEKTGETAFHAADAAENHCVPLSPDPPPGAAV